MKYCLLEIRFLKKIAQVYYNQATLLQNLVSHLEISIVPVGGAVTYFTRHRPT